MSPGGSLVCVLVGPPGVGKTAVGTALARRLGVAFRDTDIDVEQTAGMPVREIFLTKGEPTFRELEREAVARALADHSGVLSLGGGAVLDPGTRAALASHMVVLLDASLSVALRRAGMTGSRPLLLGNTRAQLRTLMAERRPFYDDVATYRVDTSSMRVAEVVEHIAGLLDGAPEAEPA